MSSRKITDLALDLQPLALEFITQCREAKIEVLITCTYRSGEEQDRLYAQGRSEKGRIVTYARAGQSPHNLSINGKPAARAFDAYPLANGKPIFTKSGPERLTWLKMGEIATALGLQWGGNFKVLFKDFPHFQMK